MRKRRREEEVKWRKKGEDEVGVRVSLRKPLDAQPSPGDVSKERTN